LQSAPPHSQAERLFQNKLKILAPTPINANHFQPTADSALVANDKAGLKNIHGGQSVPIAQWDNTYKTGHQAVDAQHQQLFEMVNELHDAIVAKKANDVLVPTLEKLAKYTVEHFRTEEGLMNSVHYPHLATHRQKHQALTKEVLELMEKYRTGKAVLSLTLSSFLAKWLQHHIKEDDVALVKYLKEHPESLAAKSGR
jgi:hemerythrin